MEHREGRVERLLLVLMGARLALALGSLVIGVVLDAMGGAVHATEGSGFYVTVALCFVATLVYRPFVGRIRRPRVFAAINVATDLALVSALVLFSGGRDSVFTFLYVAVGLYGAVLFPGWGGLSGAVAGSVAYGVVLYLGQRGWLAVPPEPFAVIVSNWLAHMSAMLGAAALASFLARELERTGRALEERSQDLAHLRTLHEHTVESLRSGLLTTDLEGRVTSFNREAERITGRARPAAIGRDLEEVLPGLREFRTRPEAAARGRMAFQSGSGRSLHLGVGCYALRDADGVAVGDVVIFQDVTEVVAMERDLRRSERLAAVGELSASIAHEIRNPLAAISGSIQMMRAARDHPAEGEARKLMGIVVREVDRLDHLIDDFLQFARPGELRLGCVSVSETVEEVLYMFEGSRPDGVEIVTEIPADLKVRADPGQLRQVLWNLVLNGAQAMPEGGTLRLEARVTPQGDSTGGRMDDGKGARVEISVLDQGSGIPVDIVERVFDPFFTTKVGGTGLGLAIVHRVIAEHRGAVRVERPGDGFATAIRLSLPGAQEVV